MLKLIMCVKRLARLSREEFDGHWIDAERLAGRFCRQATISMISATR